MRKKEQLLWDNMRKEFGAKMILERIENLVSVGRPDVDVMCDGTHSAVELKAVEKFPARSSTAVLGREGLSQEQKNWHMEWTRHGGRSFILIGVAKGRDRQLFMVPGARHDEVNGFTQEELRPYKMTWAQIHGVLKGYDR